MDLRIDLSDLVRVGHHFEDAAKLAPIAVRRAINHTGDKARTAVRVALVDQTGLKRKTMNKAIRSTRAGTKNGGTYTIKSAGGDVSLKYFGARETRAGVSAAPWNKRSVFGKTFIKGGLFPNRVALQLNGQVFKRSGKGRLPIVKQKSGLYIPTEMVTGHSAETFFETVTRDLPARIAHEVERIL